MFKDLFPTVIVPAIYMHRLSRLDDIQNSIYIISFDECDSSLIDLLKHYYSDNIEYRIQGDLVYVTKLDTNIIDEYIYTVTKIEPKKVYQ